MSLLNGSDPYDWLRVTHLLVEGEVKIKRSAKVMVAMSRASYVVTVDWLRSCIENKTHIPPTHRVDVKVPKNEESNKTISADSLERASVMRKTGKGVLSGCAISLCKQVAGKRAPTLQELECMVTAAGADWMGECIPEKQSRGKRTIVITSDPCSKRQEKALKIRGDGVLTKTTSWLFDTLMFQRLDLK